MLWGVFTSSEKDAIENVKKKTWLHSWNYIQLYKLPTSWFFYSSPESLGEFVVWRRRLGNELHNFRFRYLSLVFHITTNIGESLLDNNSIR